MTLPAIADLEKQLGVIGDDAVDLVTNVPLHPADGVDGPAKDGAAVSVGLAQESPAAGTSDRGLQQVEVHIGHGVKQGAGVGQVGADIGQGKAGEVLEG